ncbi:hypothetical protein ZIOFF_067121 [Zingiber officinale]|uniref:Protein kinase domain-containing protein n=1 Tax=Zingiber officinale TaxID=94328 RepID=A0A8J5EUK2_ZINOF|nr:hypothetical protein ZIOFF_067121 [Zingiber officinale]
MAPPQSASPPARSGIPVPDTKHTNSSNEPSSQENPDSGNNGKMSTLKLVAYVVVSLILAIVIILLVIFCISKYQERKADHDQLVKSQTEIPGRRFNEPRSEEHSAKTNNVVTEFAKVNHNDEAKELGSNAMIAVSKNSEKENEHKVDPIAPSRHASISQTNTPPTSATSFSVAELQQSTNYFNEENLVRDSMLGKVYLAEISGRKLEVLKLDNVNSRIPVDDFLELVLTISELRHPNIVELVGYCAEFDQRLLVYKHLSKKTLDYVIHVGDDLNGKLSWVVRLEVALGAARALEYLHKGCQPPLVHQNFELANILINDKLVVRVTECGLSSLMLARNGCNDDGYERLRQRPADVSATGGGGAGPLETLGAGDAEGVAGVVERGREEVDAVSRRSRPEEHQAPPVLDGDAQPKTTPLWRGEEMETRGRMRALYSYEAPEINEGGQYTERSDVYSFGVVMLELLTGRKPYDSTRPRAEQHLVRWASSQLYDINALTRMVDPSLAGRYSEKSLSCFADIISRCIQQEPEFRPAMSDVVQDLIRMIKDLKGARN